MISAKPMMALSGVRSSWLTWARKVDLARLALSAASLALRRSPSIALRAVMSSLTARKWVTAPVSSRTGAMAAASQ